MILAVLMALSAILASPNVEPADFVSNVVGHCHPVVSADFVGCEAGPLPSEDETDYAGWTPSNGFIAGP